MRHNPRSARSIIPVVLLGLAVLSFLQSAVAADQSGATVYLDPNNGNVIKGPGVPDTQKRPSDSDAAAAGTPKPGMSYQSWQTKSGTPMLKVTPGKDTGEQVVHCPDGSLRMGRVSSGNNPPDNRQGDDSSREALCNKS